MEKKKEHKQMFFFSEKLLKNKRKFLKQIKDQCFHFERKLRISGGFIVLGSPSVHLGQHASEPLATAHHPNCQQYRALRAAINPSIEHRLSHSPPITFIGFRLPTSDLKTGLATLIPFLCGHH